VTFTFGETISYSVPGTATGSYDAQGNPTFAAPTTVEVTGVGVAPLASDEVTEAYGPRSVTGYMLLLPYGTTIPADRLVTVRGESGWQVQAGSADSDWRSPFTDKEHGTTVTVRRAS
jgi:hypothetical protein